MADLLEIGIDSKGAQKGADDFGRAAQRISNSAGGIQQDLNKTTDRMRTFGAVSAREVTEARLRTVRDMNAIGDSADRLRAKLSQLSDRELYKLEIKAEFDESDVDKALGRDFASTFRAAEKAEQQFEAQTQKAEQELRAFRAEANRSAKELGDIESSARRASAAMNALDSQSSEAEANFKRYDERLRNASKGADDFGRASTRARSSAGQFIEAIAQGDPGELLGEIAQNGGPAAVAIVGLGLAFAGTAIALGAMTARMIELVRETDKLAKDSKLTATQIQALQVVANLTGESVEDLAENYKKIAPEVKRFEALVKSSGAAIDEDLRRKTQDAALAWEELKVSGQGALNIIAREALPPVTGLLREMGILIRDGASAWQFFGQIGGGSVAGLTTLLRQLRQETVQTLIDLTSGPSGWINLVSRDAPNTIKDATSAAAPPFPKIPKLGGSKSGGADQEAKALFDAQIQLERTQSKIRLEVEQRGIEETRALLEADYEDRLKREEGYFAGRSALTREFFAEKIRLQEQEKSAEIRHQEELLAIVLRQQARAKKPSERLAFEDDLANIRNTIEKLSAESASATREIGRDAIKQLDDDAKRARGAFQDYAATVRELDLTYREFADGSLSTATERFRDQHKAVYDLMKLVTPGQRKELEGLLDLLRVQQKSRNDYTRAGQRFDNLNEGLALEEDRIRIAVEKRIITEDQGMNRLKQVRREYRDVLLEEIDTMIALKEAMPDSEQEVSRLQRQRLEIEKYGTELSAVESKLRAFGDNAKNILQDAFYQGIVEGPRAFFQTLLRGFANLLAQLASQLLTSAFVRLMGQVFSGNSIGGGASGGGGGGWFGILSKFIVGIAGGIGGGLAGGGGSIAAPSGSAASMNWAGFLGGLASGGMVSQSGMYNVGELGAERVFLPRGSYVQNNYEMRQSSPQGAPINLTLNINGVQNPQQFQRSQAQIGASLQQMLAQASRNQ